MLPGQKFDESRLVKPGEWDALAGNDDEELDVNELQAKMDAEFAAIKQRVVSERAEQDKAATSAAKADEARPPEQKK